MHRIPSLFHIPTSEAGDYMYRFFIVTIGLIPLRGATARQCYTTKNGIQAYDLCALMVDYRDGSKCDIDYFELWGGKKGSQHMGNCGMKPKNKTEKGKTVKIWRINCYCDSGTHCAEFLSTFKEFLDKNRGKETLYQCLYDQLKEGMFLSDKGLLSTSSSVPSADVPRRKRPYLSEKAKEYLDGAIARNMFIMIFLAIVIGVSAYLTYGNDRFPRDAGTSQRVSLLGTSTSEPPTPRRTSVPQSLPPRTSASKLLPLSTSASKLLPPRTSASKLLPPRTSAPQSLRPSTAASKPLTPRMSVLQTLPSYTSVATHVNRVDKPGRSGSLSDVDSRSHLTTEEKKYLVRIIAVSGIVLMVVSFILFMLGYFAFCSK